MRDLHSPSPLSRTQGARRKENAFVELMNVVLVGIIERYGEIITNLVFELNTMHVPIGRPGVRVRPWVKPSTPR